jgi:lipid-binding SYLF domain-containing protein
MQRVTSLLPSWNKTKDKSKQGFDKAWAWADKLGAPVNRLTNKIGSEAFWPTTLDKESDKAARILRSFCKDGFAVEEEMVEGVQRENGQDGPKQKQRVMKRIPPEVIRNCVGLAIFTTMRTGLWLSGSGGSGVLIAKMENGEWSPPSGIMLHTVGLGFLVGVDIYDCVLVINNRKALDSFEKVRCTLGGEVSAVAGPVGVGGVLENDGKWKQLNRPVFTYLKSRGLYAGVQIDGTVVIERTDENERFYGERIGVSEILEGKVRMVPKETKMLMETLKMAEGRSDVNASVMEELEGQPAPGDVDVEATAPIFGVPEPDDPDPFGVLALQEAGLEIKEAGTNLRPDSSIFEYKPSPTSPIFPHLRRRSQSSFGGSCRDSYVSSKRTSYTQMVSHGVQTDDDLTPGSPSPMTPHSIKEATPEEEIAEPKPEPKPIPDVDYTKIDLGPYSGLAYQNGLDNVHHHSRGSSKTSISKDENDSQRSPQKSGFTSISLNDTDENDTVDTASKYTASKYETDAEHTDDEQEASATQTSLDLEATPKRAGASRPSSPSPKTPQVSATCDPSDAEADASDLDASDSDDEIDGEEPVVFEAAAARPVAPRGSFLGVGSAGKVVQARASTVTIPYRPPPPLPQRSRKRGSAMSGLSSLSVKSQDSTDGQEGLRSSESVKSDGFEDVHINGHAENQAEELKKKEEAGGKAMLSPRITVEKAETETVTAAPVIADSVEEKHDVSPEASKTVPVLAESSETPAEIVEAKEESGSRPQSQEWLAARLPNSRQNSTVEVPEVESVSQSPKLAGAFPDTPEPEQNEEGKQLGGVENAKPDFS